jgi:predicted transcriptional regulator
MKRKISNIFEWVTQFGGYLQDSNGNPFYYSFDEIYRYREKINNIYEIVMKLRFPKFNETEKIKRMFSDLDIKLPLYFQKHEYMYAHLIAAIRYLYSKEMYIEEHTDNEEARYIFFSYVKRVLGEKAEYLESITTEEQSYIDKAVRSWKVKRNKDYMCKIARIYMFFEYTKEIREKKRHDLIEDLEIYLRYTTREDVEEYIKEWGEKNIAIFFYKEYFFHYFDNRKEAHFEYAQEKTIVMTNSVEDLLFDSFYGWNGLDFYLYHIYLKYIGKSLVIKKKDFLDMYNRYISNENHPMHTNSKKISTKDRLWTNFLENCEINHHFIEKGHHTLTIKHKL